MGLEEHLPCTCHCGERANVLVRRSWVVDDPEALRALTENEFHRFVCARCGRVVLVEVDMTVVHRAQDWVVEVVVDDTKLSVAAEALRRHYPRTRARIVANRRELMEKARLFAAGMDDVAFEIGKLLRRMALEDREGKYELRFERIDGDQIEFVVLDGAKHLGSVRLALDVHARIAREHETARYAGDLLVDQNLARKLLDQKPGSRPQAAPSAPTAPLPPREPSSPGSKDHRFVTLPFVVEHFGPSTGARVSVTSSAVSLTIDGETGAQVAERGRHPVPSRSSLASLTGLVMRNEETPRGPYTVIEGLAGGEVRLFGTVLDGGRAGALVVLVVDAPGHGAIAVPWIAGSPPGFGIPIRMGKLVRDDDAVVIGDLGHLLVFRNVGGKLASAAVPLPERGAYALTLSARDIAVAQSKTLLFFNRATLAQLPGFTKPVIRAVHLSRPAVPHPDPARVAMAMSSRFLVDHPSLGRLTLERSAALAGAVGDTVYLDDVFEEIPGIHRVPAYHFDARRVFRSPPPPALSIEMASPASPIRLPNAAAAASEASPANILANLERLQSEHRVRISPLLLQIVGREARDPVLARWLQIVGLSFLPQAGDLEAYPMGQHLVADWGADPHLFQLVDLGNGDVHALYLYPPWCESGREPVVVTFRHEENELDFEALTFETFLAQRLDAHQGDATIVGLIRERIGLAPGVRSRGEAPRFLSQGSPSAEDDGGTGDRLSAERASLRRYLREEQGSVRPLLEIHRSLGWRYAAEQLESISDDER